MRIGVGMERAHVIMDAKKSQDHSQPIDDLGEIMV